MRKISNLRKSIMVATAAFLMAPIAAQAYGEAATIQGYLTRESLIPMIKPSWGNFIIHSDVLNNLYKLRGYQALWVDNQGQPNSMALALKKYLQAADRQGLNPADYWDAEVEALMGFTQSNPNNWITFELAVSEAVVRYVSHLSNGRFDPESIDTDIKFKKKAFTDFQALHGAISGDEIAMFTQLDQFAPMNSRYQGLLSALQQLREVKNKGGWATISNPSVALKLGVTNPIVESIRVRFNQLGYSINTTGQLIDAEFDRVLREFQANNGLTVDGVIGKRSEVIRVLNYTVNQRIAQVEVNMEKLRWLPKQLEARHIFVNLATTEFNLFEGDKKIFDFKTINGQAYRRTPSMRDVLHRIILNPTWTVPNSIAIRDKIPLLQKDPNYLVKHGMKLFDARTDQEVDAATIDWSTMTLRTFAYYIRQNQGYDNALGVMKFDLRHNPWAIYLHDTNERDLFAQSSRHRSSGCVRVERPMDLAEYLTQGLPGWDRIRLMTMVPSKAEPQSRETFPLSLEGNAIPVYLMYLTVERSANGGLRFVDDVYGQDQRISKALQTRKTPGELF